MSETEVARFLFPGGRVDGILCDITGVLRESSTSGDGIPIQVFIRNTSAPKLFLGNARRSIDISLFLLLQYKKYDFGFNYQYEH